MVDLRRSLFVSITPHGKDEILSPSFSSSSLKLLEFVRVFSNFHHNFVCSFFLLAVRFT